MLKNITQKKLRSIIKMKITGRLKLNKDLIFKTANEQRKALVKKEISAKELLDLTYERIEGTESKINSFNSLTKDLAYQTAKKVDEKIAKGEELPLLAGIPLALKDNMCTTNSYTTASSKILANFVSPYNATVVEKLNENLIPIIGKTNLDEFAMGSSTENSATKISKNPWNLNKVPGGSSGGSASAVTACESTLALGSDTGGSIRLPASFCGIVGIKPTYGRVSRYGLIAFASSLDQIGPFGRCVEDATSLLQVISGHDANDSTSIDLAVPNYLAALKQDMKGMKIGVVKELMGEGNQSEVKSAIDAAVKSYEAMGATIVEVSIPHIKYAIGVYYILATAEASSNLARFDGVKYGYRAKDVDSLMEMYTKTRAEGFGDEVKRRIMLGTYALSSGYYDAFYKKAQQIRTLIKQDFDKVFEKVDLMVTPTCPSTAFDIGSKTSDPLEMYLMDICTITSNLAGVPSMSLPCGFDNQGMPIGLQIIAPILGEEKMIQAAYSFEQANDFNKIAVL